ncbi:MAG TPA: tetratricopeptide repeat protein, partial [Woeseiaceae bacterium]|nr:tetratricopeptide repeat protein [Woeseiaceae bacterium]
VDSTAAEGYREVARLRLARIRLYQDRPNDVLELLGEPAATPADDAEDAFAARYDEVRGDAYVALGRLDDAREAYRRALSEPARDATINQELVQLKLLDLPVVAVPAANEPAGIANAPAAATGDAAGEPAAPAAEPASAGNAPADGAEPADPAAESEEPADAMDEADE